MRARAGNKIINILTICALMACTVPTFAVDAMFPLNQRGLGGYSVYSDGAPTGFAVDLTQTTLDSLASQPIPNTDPVEYYPADLKSGYELIPTDTVGTNTITKYILNDDNTLTPKYFDVNLRQTEYGEGTNAIYYKWELNANRIEFVETTNPNEAQITAKYLDYTNKTYSTTCENYSYDYGTVTDPAGTSSENPYLMVGESVFKNLEGNATSIENTLFINNSTSADLVGRISQNYRYYLELSGGAVYNSGELTTVDADFIGNFISADDRTTGSGMTPSFNARGVAIYNTGIIGNISGDFIENTANRIFSGATIYNSGSIGDITGNFIDNNGDTIFNQGTIGKITGNFINNSGYGITNHFDATISSITGNFIGNNSIRPNGYVDPYTIANCSTISNITGNFIGNGAITLYNNSVAQIDNITGIFIGNEGRAIHNEGIITNIRSDFVGQNYGSNSGGYLSPRGGAIYNVGTIGNITGDFIKNSTRATEKTYGGAIYNNGTIGNITGYFIGNYTSATKFDVEGGAIYNSGTISDITGYFIGNYSSSTSSFTNGGAIYNNGTISDITASFIENYALQTSYDANGGAIYNGQGKIIGNITGDFITNTAQATNRNAYGGAIYNYRATIGDITGSFIENSVKGINDALGGAIYTVAEQQATLTGAYNYMQLTVVDDNSNPIYTVYALVDSDGNLVTAEDFKNAVINGEVESEPVFVGSESGSLADLGMSLEEFKELANQAGYTETSPLDIFLENASGYDPMKPLLEFANTNTDGKEALTLRNSNIIGNHADVADGGTALGGAIYSENHNIRLLADDGNVSKISGNYTKVGDVVENNAIYLKNATLIFKTLNKSTIQVDDKINGANYDVFVTGDGESNTIFNDNISNANSIVLQKGNLYLGREDVLNNSNALYLADGNLHLINGSIGAIDMPTVNFVGETNLSVDVDLANETIDRITADTYNVANDAKLHVNHINLLSDANKIDTRILFADAPFASIVDYTGENPVAYTPIYKYNIGYTVNQEDNQGYFLFARGDQIIKPVVPDNPTGGGSLGGVTITPSGNPSDAFNPSVLATPAAQQSGSQAVVTESVRFAFQHADTFTQMPMNIRMSMMNNRYAVLDGEAKYTQPYHMQNKGVWVKPFTSFESMSLKNGPDVDAVTYGTIVGFDSDFKELGRGWYGVTSAYVGYNGSMIDYANVDTTMNGGLVGVTETFYKDKFFTAITATAGANVGTSNTMYGKEDFTSLVGGLGVKTGYNFEFKEGRYIIQPLMFMNYTFVNTFDYTSASGVRIDSDPMHTFQINPSMRFIANLKNGWQPYASVGMVWNVLNSSKVKADDIILPKMSMKPYVEYGLGLQRSWADRFTAYGQAMVRNGGRNGVMLSAGMRWSLGEDEPIDAI